MKDLYFTRHGQSHWNVANKICGATDIDLTEVGFQQAEELGKIVKTQMDAGEIHIDEIIASPLMRAYHTAEQIAKMTGLPLRKEPRLIEQNFGKWEGTPRDGEDFKMEKRSFANSYEGGESMLRLAQRIYSLLDDLKKDDKVYLLVAHNGIARVVNSYFFDMTNEEYGNFGIKNCQLMHYEL